MAVASGDARVVDTNVIVIANNVDQPSPACVVACARALHKVMTSGPLVIDDAWEILREYLRNVSTNEQPGIGGAFVKWALTNQANPERVRTVKITPRPGAFRRYAELPAEAEEVDPSDQKFVAVAATSPERPPILQALDSKWWGWAEVLERAGVKVEFLCPREIEETYRAKFGSG